MCEAGLSCRVCERGTSGVRASLGCVHIDASVDASRVFAPSEFPLYRLRFSKTKDDPAEYNRTTCEIEAFTMAETGSPVAWRTVSSARSWVE